MPGIRDDHPGTPASSEQKARYLLTRAEVPASDESDVKLYALADDMASILRDQFQDPGRSWEVLASAIEERIRGHEEAATVRGGSGFAISEPSTSTGGAMPTPIETSTRRRPYRGFDVERATYERILPELLKTSEGLFVVIVGEECVGPLESDVAAECAGYEAFGLGPLYIRQVLVAEPPALVTRDVAICRT